MAKAKKTSRNARRVQSAESQPPRLCPKWRSAAAKKTKFRIRTGDIKTVSDANAELVSQREVGMPLIVPAPHVEFDMKGSAGWSKDMDRRTTEFVCTIEWTWSRLNERMKFITYSDAARTGYFGKSAFDDNWGRWEKPVCKARCLTKGLGADKDAAMILLAASFAKDISYYEFDPGPYTITVDGLLSMEELDAVGRSVWGDQYDQD